ncbi:MAG: AsmA family protein, partial [Deltaproteobacteria bacterium]|nr:AsmA family protein [Deltaproteobacteria bacterium]
MKIIKWIILASVVLFLAVVAAAFVIVKSYDFNSLKPEIEAAVYDATGRKLEMKGDIKVKLGFTPNIIINDVTFSNASWAGDKVMASIGSFELEVGLLSLLKGVVEVKRLILSEPEILLQVNKKGLSNLEFTPPTVDAVTQDDIKVKAAADVVEKKAGDSKKELSVPG